MNNPSDRIRTLLALQDYRATTRSQPPITGKAYVEGYDPASGRITVRAANGAIVESRAALISDLGSGDIGLSKDEFFI